MKSDKKIAIMVTAIMVISIFTVFAVPASAGVEASIEVNKTVWDPVNETWVKELNANISDVLRFNCTIHNSGGINLSDIRFWDIMDCSLEYVNATLKIPSHGIEQGVITLPGDFVFKPKVLHPWNLAWTPDDPWYEVFDELCPEYCKNHTLIYWEDNYDGKLSECDQILLATDFDTVPTVSTLKVGGSWYHVDNVPYTLLVVNATTGKEMYIDSERDYQEINLSDPVYTQWNGVCCCKDSYHLVEWEDNENGTLDFCDYILLQNKRTGEEAWYHVKEVTIDLVVSKEWLIDDLLFPEYIELAPCQTVTIEFNASVVKCGVDNNTQFAKGRYGEGSWVYDSDIVTINVPPKPAIEVNKTVWNSDTGRWVDEIEANVGDIVRFRCEIHNNGTCCNLTDITVVDTLSESMEYADHATVDGASREPDWKVGKHQFGWNFTAPLAPCETIIIEFDAHAVEAGEDYNSQYAKGWCAENEEWVEDEDKAYVNVIGPSGDATDPEGGTKDVYTPDEVVYGSGSGFDPYSYVDIYITEDKKWHDGISINSTIYAKKTVWADVAGDIAPTDVWPNPDPGEYDIVFDDDQDGFYNEGRDAVDHPDHPGFIVKAPIQVPEFSAIGLLALIGILSVVLATIGLRKRK